MKLIILAAGRPNTTDSSTEPLPKCLRRYDDRSTVLDRIVAAGRAAGCAEVAVVGGYQILAIMQAYPSFKYYYNPAWETTGSLASLLQAAPEMSGDVLVSYGDVVFDPERTAVVGERLRGADSSAAGAGAPAGANAATTAKGSPPTRLVVAADSAWATRYEGRTAEIRTDAEKLYRDADGTVRVSRDALGGSFALAGEFAGIFGVGSEAVQSAVQAAERIVAKNAQAGIGDLVTDLSALLPDGATTLVDFEGAWAELDNEQDLARFRFGTKAETLERLRGRIKHARVLPQYTVRVGEWRENRDAVLRAVTGRFSGHLVVRSSALNEDTETESFAGSYESVLNVAADDPAELSTAIEAVCESYTRAGQDLGGEGRGNAGSDTDSDPSNQVLIQPMVAGVVMSGVAFTADLETGAPYYTINYDRSGSTDSVTAGTGTEHRTLIYHKRSDELPADRGLTAVINALREIESETGFTSLDIEFAVLESGEVVVFQVRPIAAHKNQLRVSAVDVERELSHVARYIEIDSADTTVLAGRTCAWGVMPDWNPAEIIGVNPRPLAFSLYRNIITDEIWGRSREECGYRATRPRPGIVDFAGKPYVDVRMSFTSFTPASLDQRLANTVVDGAVRHLLGHPELHDKVEFSVMPTAFDLDFDTFLNEIRRRSTGPSVAGRGGPGGAASGQTASPRELSDADLEEIRAAYRDLTDAIIAGRGISVEGELARIDRLAARRNRVISALRDNAVSPAAALALLLDDCRENGTLPFSNLARFAFVGIIQLRALVRRGLLTQARVDAFLASIETVAKEFVSDLATLERELLVARYGHLRPGTYDITSPAYHEAFDTYVDLSARPAAEEIPRFALTGDERTVIDRELAEAGLSVDADALLRFVRAAVQGRERGKFEFSRNLSLAIDIIATIAEREGLSRDEASFLTVDEFLALSGGSRPSGMATLWRSRAARMRNRHLVTSAIKLPPVISSPRDLSLFEIADESPNFITRKSLTAPLFDLDAAGESLVESAASLSGAIVLIENADPGYDWIFSHGIAGLVTRFGGANSHMTIRCAEFEIPAAIGCGEAIFERLLRAHVARLDCDGKRIEVVR